MKQTTLRSRHITHILLVGLVFSLFISTSVAAEHIYPENQSETEAIERTSTMEGSDISMTKESTCTGENFFPSSPAKEGTQTGSDHAIRFKDRYTVCSKAVDKGCLITGLTETRK